MKPTKTSAKTYLVTFAAIAALPFALLHAGGDSYQQNSAANPTEPTTRVGANAENVNPGTVAGPDTDYTPGAVRNDSTYTGATHTGEARQPDAFDTTTTPANDAVQNEGAMASETQRDQPSDAGMASIGPEVDGSSRNANGVARAPNELKARALDVAISQRQDRDFKVKVGDPEVQGYDTSAAPASHQPMGTLADLNHEDAIDRQLNTEATARNIESTEFANRDLAITMAESGVTEGKQIVSAIRSTPADADARQDLDKAIRKVEKAEQKLYTAIVSGRNSTESRWNDVRGKLADRYEDYADALKNAREVAVDGGVRFESHVSLHTPLPDNRG